MRDSLLYIPRKILKASMTFATLMTWMLLVIGLPIQRPTVVYADPHMAGRFFQNPPLFLLHLFRSESSLTRGKFLVASRQLGDSRFIETVIFLLQYDTQGAMGVIINRPVPVKLSTLFPDIVDLQQRTDSLYFGGPVAQNRLLLLFRSGNPPDRAHQVWKDVYISTSRTVLRQIIEESRERARFRVYAGYAGWAPGQLDHEVWRGDWHVLEADTAIIFEKTPSEIWPELIQRSTLQKTSIQGTSRKVHNQFLFPDGKGLDRNWRARPVLRKMLH